MRYFILALAFTGCSPKREPLISLPDYAVHQWLQRGEQEPLSRVVIIPIPASPDLRAAIYDWQREWWGSWGIYHIKDGAVDWAADGSGGQDEQSIHRIRAFQLPEFDGPIIEVLGMTHMGNGSLYLYELRGKQLALLLTTRAVACNSGRARIRDTVMDISYPAAHPGARPDVVLCGELNEYEGDDEMISDAWYIRQVFTWDPIHRRYVEKRDVAVGIPECWD